MKKLKLFFKNLNKKKKKTKVEDTLKIKKDKLAKSTKNEVKNTIISSIVIFVISIVLLVGIFGLIYLKMIIDDAPTFNVSDLTNYESSKIYDINGELVADVGSVMRENVSYDEMPQAFIDAFIATEDSRFFVHNGFDLPRFTKSVLENLKTLSFSQGASTISMQLMRNVYFTDDASGVNRVKSLSYKIQQIYLAIKCEQVLSKKTIFEYYVNRINYGASSTRGVKGAAQYYFGKDVNELDLSECAYLAGVINAPNANNAYKHYDAAVKRRNNVLYLMNLHGYISDEEYELAKSIELADQLVGANVANSAYQAYVNEVVDECLELTGKDPYISALNIYTYMDRNLQERIEGIERGEITSFSWPDDYVQCGIVTMDNSTGAILAIGGGRDSIVPKGYSRVSDMKRQPGSSVKPFLSYALAFEYLGYATSYTVEDIPVVYKGTSIEIHNADEIYHGDLLLKDAIGKSYNIPAYKTLEKLADTLGS